MQEIKTEMTGVVTRVARAAGDLVREGETVVMLESMKMELPVESPRDGTLAEITCAEGASVREGDVVARLE